MVAYAEDWNCRWEGGVSNIDIVDVVAGRKSWGGSPLGCCRFSRAGGGGAVDVDEREDALGGGGILNGGGRGSEEIEVDVRVGVNVYVTALPLFGGRVRLRLWAWEGLACLGGDGAVPCESQSRQGQVQYRCNTGTRRGAACIGLSQQEIECLGRSCETQCGLGNLHNCH